MMTALARLDHQSRLWTLHYGLGRTDSSLSAGDMTHPQARRPDLCKPPVNRSAIASLEKVPEDFPAERGSPAEQDNARDDEAQEQEFAQELQSPSDGGGARVETSSM